MAMGGDRPNDVRFFGGRKPVGPVGMTALGPVKHFDWGNGGVATAKPHPHHRGLLGAAAHFAADAYHGWTKAEHGRNVQLHAQLSGAPTYAARHGRSNNTAKAWADATGLGWLGHQLAKGVRQDVGVARRVGRALNTPLPNVVPDRVRRAPGYKFLLSNPSGLGGAVHEIADPLQAFLARPSRRTFGPALASAMAAVPVGPRAVRGEGAKLSNAEVASRPWFRGDAIAWQKFDPQKAEVTSLFGPGLYLTDSGQVAHSYLDKGAEDLFGTQRVLGPGRSRRMYAGSDRQARAEFRQRVEDEANRYRANGYDISNLRRGSAAGKGAPSVIFDYAARDAGPVFRSYDLSRVRNTLHEKTAPSAVQGRAIRNAIDQGDTLLKALVRRYGRGNVDPREVDMARQRAHRALDQSTSRGQGAEYWWAALRNMADLGGWPTVDLMREAGIQGMQYHGGQRVGGQGSHTAMALWDAGAARPNYGVVSAPKGAVAARSQEALARYLRAVEKQKPSVGNAGAEQGSRLVDPRAYSLMDLYGLARQYAKDHPAFKGSKRPNQNLWDEYVSNFIYAAQKRADALNQAEAPQFPMR